MVTSNHFLQLNSSLPYSSTFYPLPLCFTQQRSPLCWYRRRQTILHFSSIPKQYNVRQNISSKIQQNTCNKRRRYNLTFLPLLKKGHKGDRKMDAQSNIQNKWPKFRRPIQFLFLGNYTQSGYTQGTPRTEDIPPSLRSHNCLVGQDHEVMIHHKN